jgi:prolyl oligopeptidase PreP (S9A serine peptidase family)
MQEKVEGDAEMLLDPNTWSEDGTVALAIMKFSQDAEYLAYGQSASGSDWITIKVIHVADRVLQPDTLSWVRLHCSLLLLQSYRHLSLCTLVCSICLLFCHLPIVFSFFFTFECYMEVFVGCC